MESVWHGTGGFPSQNIYTDKLDGFMMQFASDGQWGRGLYFAKEATYSHIYASKAGTAPGPGLDPMASDEREMLQASLLLGNVVEMDRDSVLGMKKRLGGRLNVPPGPDGKVPPGLVAPPFLNSEPPLYEGGEGAKFNTVAASCCATMIACVGIGLRPSSFQQNIGMNLYAMPEPRPPSRLESEIRIGTCRRRTQRQRASTEAAGAPG